MNHLTTSTGERISRSVFDSRVERAKAKKKKDQFENEGFNFCTICEINDCWPIQSSHIESVDSCIKNGYCEKAYDLNNIQIAGQPCHQKHDGLDLKFTKTK